MKQGGPQIILLESLPYKFTLVLTIANKPHKSLNYNNTEKNYEY